MKRKRNVNGILRSIWGSQGLTSEQKGRLAKLVKDCDHDLTVGNVQGLRAVIETIAKEVLAISGDETKHQ